MSNVAIKITAPFAIGDVVALIHREGDESQKIVLRDGLFHGEISGRPRRIQLTVDGAPPGENKLNFGDGTREGSAEGTPVDVETLFDQGCDISDDGTATYRITWGSACHSEHTSDTRPERRFASFEHFMCADYIGKNAVGNNAALFDSSVSFDRDTGLPVGDKELKFGEIVALAGDYYAYFDDEDAGEFSWAWPEIGGLMGWIAGDYRRPTLKEDSQSNAGVILGIVMRDKDSERGTAGEITTSVADTTKGFPLSRYAALASQNFCHFRAVRPNAKGSIDAMDLYHGYHRLAMHRAADTTIANRNAALKRALAIDAFGCHFLTDSFASGHMRVPRRELFTGFGVLLGSLKMSKAMHDEDNKRGLWCATKGTASARERRVWRAYGDGRLRSDEATLHRRQVQESVRRSSNEVFTAWATKVESPTLKEPVDEVLPVLLTAGDALRSTDKMVDGREFPDRVPNHQPMYAVDSRGQFIFR